MERRPFLAPSPARRLRRAALVAALLLLGACSADGRTPEAATAPSTTPTTADPTAACDSVTTDEGSAPDPSGGEPAADAVELAVVRTIPVAADPVALAFGAGSLWVVSMGGGTVSRVDPASGTVAASVEMGDALGYGSIAVDDSAVWLARMGDATLVRLDPSDLAETGGVPLGAEPDRPYTVAIGAGSVWVTDQSADTVTRVDGADLGATEQIDVRVGAAAPFEPTGVAVADGGVWVGGHGADALMRIDPESDQVAATVCLGSPNPGRIVATDTDVWVADIGGVVNRFSVASMEVEDRVGVLPGPLVGGLAVGDGAVWVANASHLVRIDPTTSTVDAALLLSEEAPTDRWPGGLAVAYGAGSAWITHPTDDAVLEVRPTLTGQ